MTKYQTSFYMSKSSFQIVKSFFVVELLLFVCLYHNIAQEYTKIVTEKGNGTLKTSHTIALDAYISVHPNRFSFFFFSFPSFFLLLLKILVCPAALKSTIRKENYII